MPSPPRGRARAHTSLSQEAQPDYLPDGRTAAGPSPTEYRRRTGPLPSKSSYSFVSTHPVSSCSPSNLPPLGGIISEERSTQRVRSRLRVTLRLRAPIPRTLR